MTTLGRLSCVKARSKRGETNSTPATGEPCVTLEGRLNMTAAMADILLSSIEPSYSLELPVLLDDSDIIFFAYRADAEKSGITVL